MTFNVHNPVILQKQLLRPRAGHRGRPIWQSRRLQKCGQEQAASPSRTGWGQLGSAGAWSRQLWQTGPRVHDSVNTYFCPSQLRWGSALAPLPPVFILRPDWMRTPYFHSVEEGKEQERKRGPLLTLPLRVGMSRPRAKASPTAKPDASEVRRSDSVSRGQQKIRETALQSSMEPPRWGPP